LDQDRLDQADHFYLDDLEVLVAARATWPRSPAIGRRSWPRDRSWRQHERALALSGTGFTFIADGDQDQARSAFEQSLPLFRQAGDPLGAALAAAALGHVLASQHDYERCRRRAGTGHEPAREADTGERTEQERVQYLLIVALADNFLGQIQLSNADYDRAAQLFTGGAGRGPQHPGPVHDPHLTVRPGAQQPGPGRPRTALRDCSGKGCRWRPKPETSQPPPTTSRRWPP